MIPLFAINLFITGVIAIGIAIKLFLSYTKGRSDAIYYFAAFYLFLGIFLALNGTPLFTSSIVVITTASMIGYFSICIAYAYNSYVSCSIAGRQELGRFLFDVFVLGGIFMLIMRILNFNFSEIQTTGEYIYWVPVFSSWLRLFVGVGGVAVFAISSGIFFVQGARHKNDVPIYHRSLFLGFGMLTLLFAALIGFVLALINYFFSVLFATIFIIVGLFLGLKGIMYKIK